MEKELSHGDILHCVDTGEYLMLMERKGREYDDDVTEPSWDILDLLFNRTFWEWEFVLDDHKVYERVA